MFRDVREGRVDSKMADALNTLVKNQIYLNVKLRMDYLKIYAQAQMKKITLPENIVPDLSDYSEDDDDKKKKTKDEKNEDEDDDKKTKKATEAEDEMHPKE